MKCLTMEGYAARRRSANLNLALAEVIYELTYEKINKATPNIYIG